MDNRIEEPKYRKAVEAVDGLSFRYIDSCSHYYWYIDWYSIEEYIWLPGAPSGLGSPSGGSKVEAYFQILFSRGVWLEPKGIPFGWSLARMDPQGIRSWGGIWKVGPRRRIPSKDIGLKTPFQNSRQKGHLSGNNLGLKLVWERLGAPGVLKKGPGLQIFKGRTPWGEYLSRNIFLIPP